MKFFSLWRGFVADWRFLTVLPLPGAGQGEALDSRLFPVVGWILGALAAAVYVLADAAGLAPWLCALLALGFLGAATGLLHEDGLGDVADSMGGRDREQRLAILRDSRIGAYGVGAILFCVLLRWAALAGLGGASAWTAAAALMTAAAFSRAAMGFVAGALDNARADGLSATLLPRPPAGALALAGLLAVLPGLLLLGAAVMALAVVLAGAVLAGLALWARKRLGGRTGDVLGASQILAECALLLAANLVAANALQDTA